MERVVQFTAPRQVEVTAHERAALPAGHLRVRTRYSGISAGTGLTAYRGTNPYPTRSRDPGTRLFREDAAGLSYPVAGWGCSEVGEVGEVAEVAEESPEPAGTPGLPAVGDLVWGMWGHRGEGIVPAERLTGRPLPAGSTPWPGRSPGSGPLHTTRSWPPDCSSARTSPSSARASSGCSPPGRPR